LGIVKCLFALQAIDRAHGTNPCCPP
jgi:hypothetical protein